MASAPKHIVVMGVAGSGKSTLAVALAKAIDCPFVEGDDLHNHDARTKMSGGIPLNDEDRWPWLARIAKALNDKSQQSIGVVATCSALKNSYRAFLTRQADAPIIFIYLELAKYAAADRLTKRKGHYMPDGLNESQFQALEAPGTYENAITIDATQTPDAILQKALVALKR